MKPITDISLDLRNKIRRDLIISDSYKGEMAHFGSITFSKNEKHLFDECIRWKCLLDIYFKTSYNCYRMTRIGRFYNIRPCFVQNGIAEFDLSHYDKPSWRDWFDIEGNDDGALVGVLGSPQERI